VSKKILNTLATALFFALFFGFPFEHFRMRFFRSFSLGLYEKFEETASFMVHIPRFIDKKIHLYASDILILGIAVLVIALKHIRIKALLKEKSMHYLMIFILICNLSILFSPCRQYYYLYLSTIHLTLSALLFFLASLYLRSRKELLPLILIGIVLIGSFESLLGIAQFLLQKSIGFHLLGEPKLGPHLGSAVLPLAEKGRWLVEFFGSLPQGQEYLIRSAGTFPHANIFAGFLVLSLMMTHAVFMDNNRKGMQIGVGVCLSLQIFALFLTFSRAGMLAYLLATGVWFGFVLIRKATRPFREKNKLLALASTILFSGLLSILLLYPHLEARGGFFNYNSFVQYSDLCRTYSQKITFEILQNRPVLGVGYSCFTFFPPDFLSPDLIAFRDRPHNIYLLIAGETGVLGLGVFLLFIFSLIRPFFSTVGGGYCQTFFAIFVGFLFIGLCDLYFLTTQIGRLMFFLMAGLLAAHAPSYGEKPAQLKSIFNT